MNTGSKLARYRTTGKEGAGLSTVTTGINIRVAGAQVIVNNDAKWAYFQPGGLCQSGFGTYPNGKVGGNVLAVVERDG